MPSIQEYERALQRLRARGANITYDAVAIEAGVKKGTIKRSRPRFARLIEKIDRAKEEPKTTERKLLASIERLRGERDKYRHLYEVALEREAGLIHLVHLFRRQVKGGDAG